MNKPISVFIAVFLLAINSGCDEAKTGKLANEILYSSTDVLKRYLTNTIDFENDTISGNFVDRPIEELKTQVFRGDLNAYRQLRNALMDSPEDQFFWSFHIANTYDNAQAYFDMFFCLLKIYNCDEYKVEKMSIKTQTIALEYLLIAAKKGHKQANEVISDYYPELMKEI